MQSSVAGLLHAFDPGEGTVVFWFSPPWALCLCRVTCFCSSGLACLVPGNRQIKTGAGTFFVLRLKDADSEGHASANFS